MREVVWRFVDRWAGMLLCGVGLVATLALALAGDLILYIHPRYVVFTVVLSLVGVVLFALAIWFASDAGGRGAAHREHGHEHGHDHREHGHGHGHDHGEHEIEGAATGLRQRASTVGVGLIVVVAALALLVAPPATLSAERALTSTAATDGGGDVPAPVLVGSDPTRFSVRDWATILGTGSTAQDLVGQRADVTGVVLIDPSGAARIGRYAVTCCTVDAQLFAIPVDRATLPVGVESGDWVRATGTFADVDGLTRLVAETAEEVGEPDEPYIS